MELTNLIKDNNYRRGGVSQEEYNTAFAKLFGVEAVWFASWRGKAKSRLMTVGEISDVILKNKLVANPEEAKKETELLLTKEMELKKGYSTDEPYVHFCEYKNQQEETKYRLQLGHYEHEDLDDNYE